RSRAFTLPQLRQRSRAFTLVELLVVIGIIAVLLAALVPAVTSLSKSKGRKGALGNLATVIEQGRALALADSRNTYIAFATIIQNAGTSVTDEYSYRSYAVFEDDAAGIPHNVQVTKWQKLPRGISFRSQNEPSGAGTSLTSNSNPSTAAFIFSPTAGTITCPYLQFDPLGSVAEPTSAAPMRLVIFEGSVNAGTETPTARDSSQQPVRDEISVGRYNGRAQYVAQ
ncbi:MAG: type II secretion system protein, partial [Chthoniobacterales bacterium]